jgi:hypothetical protein
MLESACSLHLTFLQYAAATNAPGLLLAQEDLLGYKSSEWRNWFLEDFGAALPPIVDPSCSAYEKLAIVQL